jgi:hypothetical protein
VVGDVTADIEATIIKEVEVERFPLKNSFRHGRVGNRPEWLGTSHM